MVLLTHVFYLFSFFAIIWELSVISSPKKTFEAVERCLKTPKDKYSKQQTNFFITYVWLLCLVVYWNVF